MPIGPALCTCGALVEVEKCDGRFRFVNHTCGRAPVTPAAAAPPAKSRKSYRRPSLPSGEAPFAPWGRVRGDAITLWLPRAPRSVEGPNGRSWKRKAAGAAAWRDLARQALARCGAHPRWGAARFEYVVYHATARPQDRDNLVTGLGKPVQDEVVAAGVLPGDGPDVVVETPSIEQRPSPLPWGFVVVTVRRARRRSS